MKKVLFALAAGAMLFAGCTKGLEERVSVLEEKVASLEEVVAALDREMDGISTIVSNLQKKVYVTGVTPITDISGNTVGYTINFTQGEPVTITNGSTGPQGPKGDSGLTPTIDMFEGEWYWKYAGGDWILDSAGNKIPAARQLDFEIGDDGHLYVTIQGGSRIDLGVVVGKDGENGDPGAPGAPGAQGDSWFDGVTVDETAGVVTISIKGSEHDIVFPLYQFTFKVTVPENVVPTAGAEVELTYAINEAAAATTVVRAYPSKGLEVVVDRTANKVVVTLGTVAGYVDLYAINNATGDIKAQTVEFAAGELVTVNLKETELVLAPDASGSVEIPVSTACQYDVVVPEWATATVAPATKAVRDEVITVKATAANTTANDYTGYVVLKEKGTDTELFKVALVQKNYLPSLIADAQGETIKWEESFDLYRSESDITSGEQPKASYKNVFTVALSDDFSKGVYKISNMFKADMYYNQGQMISNKGGEYYADVEGNVLTIKYKGSTLSYGFSKDINLVYDAEAQTIASTAPIATYAYGGVLANRECFVVNYSVAVKVEAPAQDGSIAGTWDQVATATGADTVINSTVTIAVDGNTVTLTDFLYAGVVVTGTFNGNTITIPANTMIGDSYGPIVDDLVLTISADNKTITAPAFNIAGWIDVTGYTATKQGGAESSFDVTAICGEYWETFSGYPTAGTTIIEVSDDSNYDVKMTFFKPLYGTNCDVAYGTVNADGTVITIAAFTSNFFGPCSAFDITVDGTNLSGTYAGALAYTATKK